MKPVPGGSELALETRCSLSWNLHLGISRALFLICLLESLLSDLLLTTIFPLRYDHRCYFCWHFSVFGFYLFSCFRLWSPGLNQLSIWTFPSASWSSSSSLTKQQGLDITPPRSTPHASLVNSSSLVQVRHMDAGPLSGTGMEQGWGHSYIILNSYGL